MAYLEQILVLNRLENSYPNNGLDWTSLMDQACFNGSSFNHRYIKARIYNKFVVILKYNYYRV